VSGGSGRAQDLQRNVALEAKVTRLMDGAHASGPSWVTIS
jgi:hypothetical protein